MTIVFWSAFMSQPVRTNSVASQSSSSGCDGHSPCEPKSSTVLTSPVPNAFCQKRLTATRAGKRVCRINQPLGQPEPVIRDAWR